MTSLTTRYRLRAADDQYAHIVLRGLGIELQFTAESFLNSRKTAIREDEDRKTYILTDVTVFRKGVDGYGEFQGALPGKIRFATSRSEVTRRLGAPLASGGGVTVSGIELEPWDKYRAGDYVLGIGFLPDDSISNINLTTDEFWGPA